MKRTGHAAVAGGAGLVAALMVVACTPVPPEPSGQSIYQDFCQACHGTSGKGDGPTAKLLPKRPADLTRIAARSGGRFPLVKVMSTIDGYTRLKDHSSIMPEMGPVLEGGGTVMIDTGDGLETPVPERLLAIADYLRGLQRP